MQKSRQVCQKSALLLNRIVQDESKLTALFHSDTAPTVTEKASAFSTKDLTSWLSDHVANFTINDLSAVTVHRSKRMILDCLGVGVIGAHTEVSGNLRRFAQISDRRTDDRTCTIWGVGRDSCSASMAAFLNASSCHAMDFDDTWHPATHPSSPVLPAILAVSESLPPSLQPSLQDILVAFNVGVQVQGSLLRCSLTARDIPNRLHPPAIVGVMGSAAAVARLLSFGPHKCRHALAIAASFAGAPMANAGTTTKPLHAGKAARLGLEAALLADIGIEGNPNILDMESGFGAYFKDFRSERLFEQISEKYPVILQNQDIAIKRFPCHLGMHWGIDASVALREKLMEAVGKDFITNIQKVEIVAPKSRYINRPVPESEHDARHSFQFTTCSALLDGLVTPETFNEQYRKRPALHALLNKTSISSPEDNRPCFDTMYVEVKVTLWNAYVVSSRCDTPYGHWRRPLSDDDVIAKFRRNTSSILQNPDQIIKLIRKMSPTDKISHLENELQSTKV